MKVETREDALLHCFDLWLWLAVTGGKLKYLWPGWKAQGGYLEHCFAHCPTCEYTNVCATCIINWNGIDCNTDDGEFKKWGNAKTKQERTKWALKIAALALDAL